MSVNNRNLWTIDELGARVALALAQSQGQPSGRVREVPDLRTIRYYTTLGLIDRPVAMRGRTALYGRRHLMQLVAVKRLQTRGLSLAEVQQKLVGLPNGDLERLAQLPPDLEVAPASSSGPVPESRAEAFWTTMPAPMPDIPNSKASRNRSAGQESDVNEAVDLSRPLVGISLGRDVALLLAAARSLDTDDIAALRTAAGPLLKLLIKRRLLRPLT
jgi:DNA-binding transcriptional MerR regulator